MRFLTGRAERFLFVETDNFQNLGAAAMQPDEIVFLRKRDYKFIRELGAGACGRTVLLHDPEIEENFVCKKYAPLSEAWRERLFGNFVTEIKVLHRVYHQNVVRIFNYYVFRDRHSGYILMEFVEGSDISTYLGRYPEQAGAVFTQVVSGFRHLEEHRILHRDIRPGNILVGNDGVAKIIDFGFGKEISHTKDFDRSISLNWWCETPNDFAVGRYDFSTEVYFVGKLFEAIIRELEIEDFPYLRLLSRMCQRDASERIGTFVDVDQAVSASGLPPDEFSEQEIQTYRRFSATTSEAVTKIERNAQFESEAAKVELQLEQVYRSCLLEDIVPDPLLVIRVLLRGQYYFRKDAAIPVGVLKDFVNLLKSSPKAKKNIVISNLQTKLSSRPRYDAELDQDVPF